MGATREGRRRRLVVAVGAALAGASFSGTLRVLYVLHASHAQGGDARRRSHAQLRVPAVRGTAAIAPSPCGRSFRVGDRADFQATVRGALVALGLCEQRTGKQYHVYFGEQLDAEVLRGDVYLHPAALVNTIPGMRAMVGEKDALASLHRLCLDLSQPSVAARERLCDFSERGFAAVRHKNTITMPSSAAFVSFNRRMAESWPHFWIVKPQLSYNQAGISLAVLDEGDVSNNGTLFSWLHSNLRIGHSVLQSYLRFPLLFGKEEEARKFDLRVWCIVSSIDPLRMLLQSVAFPKVATVPYSADRAYVNDDCMHFRLPSAPHCHERLVYPYPSSTASPVFAENVYFPDGRRLDWQQVLPGLERVLATVVLLARTAKRREKKSMLEEDEEMRSRPESQFQKRFSFLAPDVLIRADGTVSLIELNTNGFMLLRPPFDDIQPVVQAGLMLLGANGYPHRAEYNSTLEMALGQLCEQRRMGGCTESEAWALREFVHELQHAHTGWYGMFPTTASARTQRSLVLAGAAAERTPLDSITHELMRLLEAQPGTRELLRVPSRQGSYSPYVQVDLAGSRTSQTQ